MFIAQDNGAELEFAASDLTTTPPETEASAPRARGTREPPKPLTATMPARALTPADVTPEHIRVLGIVPQRTLRAIGTLYERRPEARRFSTLDTAAKLNAITEITAIPYRTMREYSDRPGELSLLMGNGLADSSAGH